FKKTYLRKSKYTAPVLSDWQSFNTSFKEDERRNLSKTITFVTPIPVAVFLLTNLEVMLR
ncbi:MAG: hypothetical protein U9P90_02380, partial [Patescibacteria group bacterium]|nr:hypothetical protein [Patescibacteria group bacterium]